MVIVHYSTVTASLQKLASNGAFSTQKYQQLKAEVEDARNACEMATEALRVHREGHKKK